VLRRLGRFCYRHRRLVVVAWLIALVATTALARVAGTSSQQGISAPGTEARRATDLLTKEFPQRAGDSGQLVVQARNGRVDAVAVTTPFSALLDQVAAVPGVVGVRSPFAGSGGQISADGTVAYAEVQFAQRSSDVPERTITRVLDLADRARADGLPVDAGGRMFDIRRGPGSYTELLGLAAAVAILLLAFGSVLAMGLPIVVALDRKSVV